MGKTFRRKKVENLVKRLQARRLLLLQQSHSQVMRESKPFIQGQLSAVESILQEITLDFGLNHENDLYDDSAISDEQWIKAVTHNPAYDFLKDPDEDIYTLEDGEAFHDEGN